MLAVKLKREIQSCSTLRSYSACSNTSKANSRCRTNLFHFTDFFKLFNLFGVFGCADKNFRNLCTWSYPLLLQSYLLLFHEFSVPLSWQTEPQTYSDPPRNRTTPRNRTNGPEPPPHVAFALGHNTNKWFYVCSC